MIKLKKDSFKMFINGEWVDAEDKAILEAYNPANSEYLANFPDASESDVNKAVDAAREAFKAWRKTTVSERATILNKIADIIDENTEVLATTESLDNGKPIRETMAVDVPLSAKHFRYFAGCILADEGQATVLEEKYLSIVLREPIGVVGQIIPWNFPFLMAAWKLAPALAAGNTIVIKPSSLTSLSLLTFVELIQDVLPQGQVCCAGSRSFVQEGIYDEFVEKIKDRFNKLKIGDPLNPETQMGSQIDEKQAEKIIKYIEIAKKEGGEVLVGGERYTENGCDKGAFVKPTLITGVHNGCRISQEEVFGPVSVVIKFKNDEEVIEQANDSEYGLAGAVFSKNITRALNIARKVETGRVWVNTYNQIPEHAPFGGYKKSGIGRETHKVILEHYSQMKNILIDLTDDVSGFYN